MIYLTCDDRSWVMVVWTIVKDPRKIHTDIDIDTKEVRHRKCVDDMIFGDICYKFETDLETCIYCMSILPAPTPITCALKSVF
jgi:hypothetical protein